MYTDDGVAGSVGFFEAEGEHARVGLCPVLHRGREGLEIIKFLPNAQGFDDWNGWR